MEVSLAEYKSFLDEVKEAISLSRHKAHKKVNKELIDLYWLIGQTIMNKQTTLGWGKSVVDDLS